MSGPYDPGNIIHITGTFTDEITGLLVDPSILFLKVKDPSGTITTYTSIVHDSQGNYHYDLLIPLASSSSGYWIYSWEASGSVIASTPDTPFQVRDSVFTT